MSVQNASILLVEDETIIAMATMEVLRNQGHTVVHAANGETAVQLGLDSGIDLILMDIDLGQHSIEGTEVAREILDQRDVPIVFLTSHSEKAMVDKVKGITRYGYVLKNAGEFVLVEAITTAFDLFEAHQELSRENRERKTMEERFHHLFNNINECVAIYQPVDDGADFEFVDLNQRGLEFSELSRDDVVGRRVTDVFPGVEVFGLLDVFRRVHRTGEPVRYPLQHYSDNRVQMWTENFVFRLPAGLVVAAYEDSTERRLQEIEYETLIDQSLDGFWRVTTDGRITRVNAAACAMSGYTESELLTMSVADLEATESEAGVEEHIQRLIEAGTDRFRSVHRRKDGTRFNVEVSTTAIVRGSKPEFLTIVRDLSDATEWERQVRENERLLRAITENIPEVAYLYDPAADAFLYVSTRLVDVFGIPPEEVYAEASAFVRFVHPEDMELFLEAVRREHEEGRYFDQEYRIVTPSGATRWIHSRNFPVQLTETGQSLTVGIAEDVTHRRRAAEQLRESQRVANLGHYEFDVATGSWTSSQQLDRILGIDASYTRGVEGFLACVHAADRPWKESHLRRPEASENVQIERRYRLIDRTDRSETWVHETASTRFGATGEIAKVFGVIQDITSAKEAENTLRGVAESREHLYRELTHRIKNNLAMVSALIHIKDSELGLRADLSDLERRVKTIQLVYEQLQTGNSPTTVSARAYAENLLSAVLTQHTGGPVDLRVSGDDTDLDTQTAVNIGMVLNELAANAMKHGFAPGEPPVFSVDMTVEAPRANGQSALVVYVSNTGNEFPPEVPLENPTSMGLQLVASIVAHLHGEVTLDRSPIPRFTLRIPLKNGPEFGPAESTARVSRRDPRPTAPAHG